MAKKPTFDEMLHLVNALFGGSPELSVFNIIMEVKAGVLKAAGLDGAPLTAQEQAAMPFCYLGHVRCGGYSIAFTSFVIGKNVDSDRSLNALRAKLRKAGPGSTPSPDTLEKLERKPPYVFAVAALCRDKKGKLIARLHHHPLIPFDQALGLLKASPSVGEPDEETGKRKPEAAPEDAAPSEALMDAVKTSAMSDLKGRMLTEVAISLDPSVVIDVEKSDFSGWAVGHNGSEVSYLSFFAGPARTDEVEKEIEAAIEALEADDAANYDAVYENLLGSKTRTCAMIIRAENPDHTIGFRLLHHPGITPAVAAGILKDSLAARRESRKSVN